MKQLSLYYLLLSSVLLTACYEDLGNYDYAPPEEPIVTGIRDSVFVAYIGDTLHIVPGISHSLAETDNFTFNWQIVVPQEARAEHYEGPELKILFGLKPGQYQGLLTVTDHSNEMKYFYNFEIEGRTEFTQGMVVLSDEGGHARLSFIKPDNSVLPDLYEGIHGEPLPGKPLQLVAVNEAWQPQTIVSYWVLCGEGEKPAVILDASTMIRTKYINDNFFDAPATLKPVALKPTMSGVTTGVISGKLYTGTTSTAPFGPLYGVFGNGSAGDYELSPHFIYQDFQYYIGFDEKQKNFVRFEGNGAYFGTDYTVIPVGEGFDPKNPGIDLLYMQYLNSNASFAFGKGADGQVYELKFSNAADMFFTSYKKVFPGSELVTENTKWAANPEEIIFFSSGDKIFRYNPLNEELKTLSTSFAGQEVSMLRFFGNNDLLLAATEGALYILDVGTGKNGSLVQKIEGIPGAPVDVVVRDM
ncbi:PKD-like family lipoprotein [Cesiribacter sp. SM1]|uniref:PKD-like family lipoprotein n=1 Tax=Cesiribacter sp. SM1 TaxID=2861196 RepID=UPI001CD1C011|nr:PKD-like family lipoprotein [Cesiribacter sp. SM1]